MFEYIQHHHRKRIAQIKSDQAPLHLVYFRQGAFNDLLRRSADQHLAIVDN